MTARRLIPLLDRVLVERVVAAVKSSGGILLPESAASKVRLSFLHKLYSLAASRRLRTDHTHLR